MNGLKLLLFAFSLLVTLGNDGSTDGENVNTAPYAEEQTVTTEPAVTEPATVKPDNKESVSYDNGEYDITFEDCTMESEFGNRPFMAKDGYIYFLEEAWNDGAYDTVLTTADDTTLDVVSAVTLKKSDLKDVYAIYACPAKDGGYLSYASKWTDEGSEHYFIKYDKNGERINLRSIAETYDLTKNGYVYGNVASDGTNFYACIQDYTGGNYVGAVLMFDENFNYVKTLSDSMTASVCVGNDGILYINDCYNESLYSYNPADDSTTLLAHIPYCGNSISVGRGDEIFVGNDVIYNYNTKTGALNKLIDFSDYDYDMSYGYDFIFRDGNGDISIYFEFYSDSFQAIAARLKLKK